MTEKRLHFLIVKAIKKCKLFDLTCMAYVNLMGTSFTGICLEHHILIFWITRMRGVWYLSLKSSVVGKTKNIILSDPAQEQ